MKGNFGTAWQNQQKEFDNVPAAILFTTNCIMPVKDSYKVRVFTTAVVQYPETVHIDDNKDFTPVIKKALELRGYDAPQNLTHLPEAAAEASGCRWNTAAPQTYGFPPSARPAALLQTFRRCPFWYIRHGSYPQGSRSAP